MHIPDGFVSDPVNAAMGTVAALSLAYSVWSLRRETTTYPLRLPLFVVVSAFVFATQMLNFSIGAGTSGHFLGAVLAAALLGPAAACVAMALVLAVQCFFFGDGGVLALGSNIANMGVLGGLLAYPVLRKLRSHLPEGRFGFYAAIGAVSWMSIVAASSLCAFEIALSGTTTLGAVLPAMVGTHAVIGLGEAAITVSALAVLFRLVPSAQPAWALLGRMTVASRRSREEERLMIAGLAFVLALALLASPLASSLPDGLEKVASDKGFVSAASEGIAAPFADYQVSTIAHEGASTGLAGMIGVLLICGIAFGSGRLITQRQR